MFIDIKKKKGKDWDLSNELVGYKKMYYCNSFEKKTIIQFSDIAMSAGN